ncbi:hypothetical protein F5X68DRAFT_14280 [Plectosphaerella plurivora]|uniref:Uncharacterized protein n=1 Tax=Plectosphaerella plurivora TaxID=936078 RepID=A0A9P9ABV9_9PEZI|nr:hypothetical protein F5X68DRAFT_14280 [Plectosphaerella plurivora]
MAERKGSEASQTPRQPPPPSFPTHNSPRTWFLTSALSPLAVRLTRLLLAHGDHVVACLPPHEIDHDHRSAEFRDLVAECKSDRPDRLAWKDRIRGVRCDARVPAHCSAAVAEAVQVFGRIDILLCCASEAVVGTVEELAASPATQALVRDQFEAVFFSQVNFIKAALPLFRSQHTGHVLVLSSTGGHIGTPGMPIYTSAVWALEGFCDSLAYEVAPFNVKVTIVQPNKEIQSLTNRIIFAPRLQQPASTAFSISSHGPDDDEDDEDGAHAAHGAPSIRDMLTTVVDSDPESALDPAAAPDEIQYRYPRLSAAANDQLVMETVHALAAIGGHENPPARHIVGPEASVAVKEKLRTVTEELEEFVDASLAVDIFDTELNAEARAGDAGAGADAPMAGT